MTTKALLEIALFVEGSLCLTVLLVMLLRRALTSFPQLGLYLAVQTLMVSISVSLLYFRRALHLDVPHAYLAYFLTYWIYSALTFVLHVAVVYAVFAEAMRPMSGLHSAGKIVFRWVAVVSGLVACALVAGPGTFSSREGFAFVVSHLQQGVSVLTLCLLVFVCFAVRPLGLTFRSHLFGVSLGLGVLATTSLVQAAWFTVARSQSLYSPVALFSAVGTCLAMTVWGTYFALPEPKRRMILLPTTSPFFFWNRISEILGDAPGHVAVAGFKPDMLAPAEIEMLTMATSREAAMARKQEENRLDYGESFRDELARTPEPSLAI